MTAAPELPADFLDDLLTRLTKEYLHPALREAGVPDPEQYRLAYDDTPLEVTA